MKSQEIKEKMEKAIEKIAKAEKSVARNLKIVEQQTDQFLKDFYSADYRRSLEKLEDAKRIAENWKNKYKEQLIKENTYCNEIPQAFKSLQGILAESWTKSDIEEKAFLKQKYHELGVRQFCLDYTYSRYNYLVHNTTESLKKANEKEAETWIIDLYNRIKKETGEPKSWNNITVSPKGLNGYVEGENGAVTVETILAGGYNIQRLHYRVILHKR